MDRITQLKNYANRLGFVGEDWYEAAEMMLIYSKDKKRIANPNEIFNHFRFISRKDKEHFAIILLDGAHNVIRSEVISIGLVNKTIVHPREIFRPAIAANSSAIIIAHNHPSGSLDPSPEDIEVTKRLIAAGEIIGIEVLDHLIVSGDKYLSFVEKDFI